MAGLNLVLVAVATQYRNIDHIVETHLIARERRRAGLPVWRWSVPIKDLLSGDTSDEAAQRVGKEIAARLRRALPGLVDDTSKAFDSDLDDICFTLEDAETADDLNDTLVMLYDWADYHRLWLD